MDRSVLDEVPTLELLKELVARKTPATLIEQELTKHPEIASVVILTSENLEELNVEAV